VHNGEGEDRFLPDPEKSAAASAIFATVPAADD
jgi:hypothetical protein